MLTGEVFSTRHPSSLARPNSFIFAAVKKYLKIMRLAFSYKASATLNILFNMGYVLFNLSSLLVFIPFLNLIFKGGEQALVTEAPEWGTVPTDEYFDLYFNYLMSDYIVANGSYGALLFVCGAAGILFLLKNVCRYMAMFFLASIRQGVVRDLRRKLYEKLLRLPVGYYSDERKGDIISRVTNDLQEVDYTMMSTLELLFREPLGIVLSLVAMFFISWQLTVFSFILLPVGALVISLIGKSLKRTSHKGQAKLGEIVSNLEETLGGIKVIKAFNAEERAGNSFGGLIERYRQIMIRLYRKRDLASPVNELLGSLVMITLVWYGGNLALSGDASALSGGEFVGFVIVFSQLLRPIQGVSKAASNISKGLASLDRLEEVLEAEETIVDRDGAQSKDGFEEVISYENVTFAYDTEPVLKDISFKLSKGKTVALVGDSGGGKSTIADLLPRFYDVQGGQITIDGQPITDLKVSDLRGLMGIVAQRSVLFNDTVFNNIAFGVDSATQEEVMEAARIANAHDFIASMEEGYGTNIGDNGSKLSGGQQQRISIARAVLANPPVLILDEATSALDPKSEKLVQDALLKLMENRTTLVIAHRLSTIQHADEILVIQAGEIVERGNHDELLAREGAYRKLYDLQSFQRPD